MCCSVSLCTFLLPSLAGRRCVVAGCCRVLQGVAGCCSLLRFVKSRDDWWLLYFCRWWAAHVQFIHVFVWGISVLYTFLCICASAMSGKCCSVCCSVLQCVLQYVTLKYVHLSVCCNMVLCVAVCDAECCNVLQCIAVYCCNVLYSVTTVNRLLKMIGLFCRM